MGWGQGGLGAGGQVLSAAFEGVCLVGLVVVVHIVGGWWRGGPPPCDGGGAVGAVLLQLAGGQWGAVEQLAGVLWWAVWGCVCWGRVEGVGVQRGRGMEAAAWWGWVSASAAPWSRWNVMPVPDGLL